MSNQLPPPIHDPTTGKTFIAIPAPPFIFATLSPRATDAPRFIYVESKDIVSRRLFSGGRTRDGVVKASLGKWLRQVQTTTPPPNHVPWESLVSHSMSTISDSSGDLEKILQIAPYPQIANIRQVPAPEHITKLTTFDSGSVMISFESMSSLLHASLPSMGSATSWVSNLDVPPFPARSARPCPASTPIRRIETKTQASSTLRPQSYQAPNHREALVFEREVTWKINGKPKHMSLQVPASEMSPNTVNMMLQLQELNDFFDNGTNTVNGSPTPMKTQDKPKLQLVTCNPSLVVSTSTAAIPISLESSNDLVNAQASPEKSKTLPLAVRRGKQTPAMLSLQAPSSDLEYPDIPTAFRGSPGAEAIDMFASIQPPVPSTTADDHSLSTSEMIAQLRAHVEHFEQELLDSPVEEYEDEPMQTIDEVPEESASEKSIGTTASLSDGLEQDVANNPKAVVSAMEQVLRTSQCDAAGTHPLFTLPDARRSSMFPVAGNEQLLLPSQNLKAWTAISKSQETSRPRPRRATTGSSDFSRNKIPKHVRFATMPPQTIPADILEHKHKPNQAQPNMSIGARVSSLSTPKDVGHNRFSTQPKIPSPLRASLTPAPIAVLQPRRRSIVDFRSRRQSTGPFPMQSSLATSPPRQQPSIPVQQHSSPIRTSPPPPSRIAMRSPPKRAESLPAPASPPSSNISTPMRIGSLRQVPRGKENNAPTRTRKVSQLFSAGIRRSMIGANENAARRSVESSKEERIEIRASTIKTKNSPLQTMINRLKA